MRMTTTAGRFSSAKRRSRELATSARIRETLALFVIGAVLAVPCLGQTTTQGLDSFARELVRNERVADALRANRPKDALTLLEPDVKSGDAKAQVLYAGILTDYLKDHQSALRWFIQARANGELSAYHGLAEMYRQGRGVKPSADEAHALYFFASTENYRASQTRLAAMYLLGEVTGSPGYADGLYWAARASTAGDSLATGLVREAEKQLSLSCDEARRGGVSPALIERFCVDWALTEYARPTQPEDCEKGLAATVRAEFRMTKAAAEGVPLCAYHLGMRNYLVGRLSLAHLWFLRAALNHHASAQYMLAKMYSEGKASAGTPARTRERETFWWAASARNGDQNAAAKVRELRIDAATPANTFGRSRLVELGYDLPAAPRPAARSSHSGIVGTWKQSVRGDAEYRYLATFKVVEQNGEFRMSPIDLSTEPGLQHPVAIHSITFDGKTWRFVSEWGSGRRGTFDLTRVSENRFEGFVWVGGAKGNANRWDRVQ